MWKLIALASLVLTLAMPAVAQAEPFIPGYTDFPSAARVADQQQARFVPGATDFPSASRVTPAGGVQTARIVASSAPSASRFDWADAGIGAGVAAMTLVALAGCSITLRRRGRIAASS